MFCFECHAYTKKGTNKITLQWECSQRRRSRLRLVIECYVIVVIIIKLHTDVDLSTIIKKGQMSGGGGRCPRRQMSGRGVSILGANILHSFVTCLRFHWSLFCH